jgi:hypothetical protein
MEYNCSSYSDFYVDCGSVRLILRLKLLMVHHLDVTRCDVNMVVSIFVVAFCVGELKACNSPHNKLPLHNLSTKVTLAPK